MRTTRFAPWITAMLAAGPAPAVTSVQPWDGALCGVAVGLDNGATVLLGWVRACGPGGDDHTQPERPVTGEPLPPVQVPELVADGGRYRLVDLEAYLVAVVTNAGHPEVAAVRGYSSDPRASKPAGLRITCYSGAEWFGSIVHAIPRGSRPRAEYDVAEAV